MTDNEQKALEASLEAMQRADAQIYSADLVADVAAAIALVRAALAAPVAAPPIEPQRFIMGGMPDEDSHAAAEARADAIAGRAAAPVPPTPQEDQE